MTGFRVMTTPFHAEARRGPLGAEDNELLLKKIKNLLLLLFSAPLSSLRASAWKALSSALRRTASSTKTEAGDEFKVALYPLSEAARISKPTTPRHQNLTVNPASRIPPLSALTEKTPS